MNTRVERDVASYLLAAGRSEDVALETEHERWTYEELRRAVDCLAAHLQGLGLSKGERVLLLGENSFFWMVSYVAILRAGLVCVPLPGTTKADDLHSFLNATTPRCACIEARALARYGGPLSGLPIVTDRADGTPTNRGGVSLDELLASGRRTETRIPDIADDDLASLMFTSGSTGTPCGVMITHRNIIANTTSIIECLQLTARDRVMAVLPFHYCFGTSLLHTHLRVGGTVVLESRFMYPEVVLDNLAKSACTGFAGVPSHFQILLRNSTIAQRQFPALRYVQQAGGVLPPALIDELRAALPGTNVFVMYGQTEATARLSYLPPAFLDAKRGSIGKGIPGVHLRVVTPEGRDVSPGDVGEITATGDNITRGYWQAPNESRTRFREGRLYTGDLATVDEDGFIYIVGRDNDFLKCRGERVSCPRLEAQILEYHEVREAAVVGIPDEVLGEAVCAFVVPRQPLQEGLVDRLRAFCKQRMPGHLIPKEIVVVADLPKNQAGKVLKRQLVASS